jgi:small subunit ribosomal protein S2
MATATNDIDVRELLKTGAHFGHKPSHWNPKMKPYIHSKRGGIYIIDLIQTAEKLKLAAEFLEEVAAGGKPVLFVGTKRHLQQTVKAAAESSGMPYVVEHWFGGMLTNFETIHGRVKQLNTLEEEKQSGELTEGRNKREISELEEEISSLNTAFGGIKDMENLPGALFVADAVTERIAIKEAKRLHIPVVAIVDTNGDPSSVDYVIPANDDAVSAVALISQTVAQAVAAGAAKYKNAKPAAAKAEDEPKAPAKAKPATTVKQEETRPPKLSPDQTTAKG